MRRSFLIFACLAVVLLAQQALPTLTAKSDFNGSIYLNETTINTSTSGTSSQRAVTISITNNRGEQDAKSIRFYAYYYKKTDEGKSELVKEKIYEVKPLESLTVTLAVRDGGGIWLEGHGKYTIIVH